MDFNEYRTREIELFNSIDSEILDKIVKIIVARRSRGGRVFVCGNGGSFLTCEHFAEDAAKGAKFNCDVHLPVITLGSNPGMLMAIANDIGWETVFAYELNIHCPTEDDIIIGLSVSGSSKNVLRAFESATEHRMFTIAFTGMGGSGPLSNYAKVSIDIDSDHFGIVEDVHSACLHYIAYKLMEKETWNAR